LAPKDVAQAIADSKVKDNSKFSFKLGLNAATLAVDPSAGVQLASSMALLIAMAAAAVL